MNKNSASIAAGVYAATPHSPFTERRERLLKELQSRKIQGMVVAKPANVLYLTGFHGSAGTLIVSGEGPLLLVDPRYTLQAEEQAGGVKVIEARRNQLSAAGGWLARKRLKQVGFEDTHLSCAEFSVLKGSGARNVVWKNLGGVVESLRAVKEPGEVERIAQAGRLTAEVFEELLQKVKPGVREVELAAEIEFRLRGKGADGVAFETIVASGFRGAYPHARASNKQLKAGELVIFDLGAILSGYAADMTRTVFLGKPPSRVSALYRAVLEAQQAGVSALKAGKAANSVDKAVRKTLTTHNLDQFFTHSTGHGVGLEIHESPRLARVEKARLQAGQVVTVEPGIYIEGLGGIRIEDTLAISTDGVRNLTPASKDNWILNS